MAFSATSSAKTARIEASVDMISDLPIDVIHKIMQFLTLDEAARMSVLSKAWKNYWVSIPRLVFDGEFIYLLKEEDEYLYEYEWDAERNFDTLKWSSIISSVLFLHKGSILEFSLTIPDHPETEFCHDITPWVSYVMDNGVKSFTLLNNNAHYPIRLPSHLFSRGQLEHLMLEGCTIGRSPCFMSLRTLSSLVLEHVEFQNGVTTEFFACCPRLEKLKVSYCKLDDGELIINMPNLNKLRIESQGMFPSISFKNASSLLSLLLCFVYYGEDRFKGAVDMINFFADSCALQKLRLGGETCELLASSDVLRILPITLTHVEVLEFPWISMYRKDVFSFVVGMIQSCLNMEKLSISMRDPRPCHVTEEVKMSENSETQEWVLGHFDNDYTFNRLHTIHIEDIIGLSIELKLISYLLACSPSLKRLSFTFNLSVTDSKKQEVCRKLFKFGKASPKAKVVHDNSKFQHYVTVTPL